MHECPVCLSYTDEEQRYIDQAGRTHEKELERIRRKEAEGQTPWHIYDSIRYHEAWAGTLELDDVHEEGS